MREWSEAKTLCNRDGTFAWGDGTQNVREGTFAKGRLSFHPIPCGSRDRPVGRKVIDESKIMCWHCACERQELCVPLDR